MSELKLLKFKSINYDPTDLINLIKNNTALITNLQPSQLIVNFKFSANGKISAEVQRLDRKDLEV